MVLVAFDFITCLSFLHACFLSLFVLLLCHDFVGWTSNCLGSWVFYVMLFIWLLSLVTFKLLSLLLNVTISAFNSIDTVTRNLLLSVFFSGIYIYLLVFLIAENHDIARGS